ncbi:MAG: glutamine--fructose-6-phosphate transaminase (isomerizing) [Gammaproteobacteria bacterium]|nr:glutamine--fructose-6-phosphate transaminase (isomerizing) [Gammaproteobacteria bacterium]
MCGIIAAVAKKNVAEFLLQGLQRLEYRGYDSAGMALVSNQQLQLKKCSGKVSELKAAQEKKKIDGSIGIAHTRWATHGAATIANAHPHLSHERIAIVHNGIIENHQVLRDELIAKQYSFSSDTDSEVIAHLIHYYLQTEASLRQVVQQVITRLQGSYAFVVIDSQQDNHLIAVRQGSPLLLGLASGGHYLASDAQALNAVCQDVIYLENGDLAEISLGQYSIYQQDNVVMRKSQKLQSVVPADDKAGYPHYMIKEIYEQAEAVRNTLRANLKDGLVNEQALASQAEETLDQIEFVQIIACGSSYHAGKVAQYWFEEIAGIYCQIDIASEFRYRKHVVRPGTLLVTISQSGETADTLAALDLAKTLGYVSTLTICNVAESSLVRASDLVLLTKAGTEIGVASSKAFTTQLVALMLLLIMLGRRHQLTDKKEQELLNQLLDLPERINATLSLDVDIKEWAKAFANKQHALFLGRGSHYPIAMEGALKLKEISYIHAEAYPAGELKHGPLALIDADMPVVTVAPNNQLLTKLKSNMEEVRARGGQLYVLADRGCNFSEVGSIRLIEIDAPENAVAPILFTVPLQLLAYHVALLKDTDVDQPRNLAKSVTVE